MRKKIGIIGATGYTGSELVRILVNHPEVEVTAITSESRKGEQFSDVHSFFKGIFDLELTSIKEINKNDFDILFLALPHGVSMDFVKEHFDNQTPIVDLSGDFRLDAPETYNEWYKKKHIFPEGFDHAVYGIPELNREQIKKATLVANPGCFPTGAILGLYPLVKSNVIEPDLIVDAKTGVTGAGVKAKPTTHFPNVNDNFKPYGVKNHRHTIEIQEKISKISGNSKVQFTPHLLPVDRGIISTIYTRPNENFDPSSLEEIYADHYKDEPFIRLCDTPPSIKDVRGTNYCNIFSTYDERTNRIITVSAIDNLVKGAAGVAVQNMNIIFDWEETKGLKLIPVNP